MLTAHIYAPMSADHRAIERLAEEAGGCTITRADGRWWTPQGARIDEPVMVYIIAFPEYAEDAPQVHKLVRITGHLYLMANPLEKQFFSTIQPVQVLTVSQKGTSDVSAPPV